MKKWLMFLFCALISVVSASVVVHNYSVDDVYFLFEVIEGEINLTIADEDYDARITSNDGDEIGLGDFLSAGASIFECSPPDCSKDYTPFDATAYKKAGVSAVGKTYVGFVLNGESVVLDSLDFEIESNFGESSRRPLVIDFFEDEVWGFSEFSDSLSVKDWGCYDLNKGVLDSIIGKSLYCETISISDSGKLYIGTHVDGEDDARLNMAVYPESGTGAEWKCDYDPNLDDGCWINETFSAGRYQVCVSSDEFTNYRIYQEDDGNNCGFTYFLGSKQITKDYAIFVRTTKYADASFFDSADFNSEDIVAAANALILKRYGRDCSNGCILPLAISGVPQSVRIYDVDLKYMKDFGWGSENEIYDLSVVPAMVDFDGILDLSTLGFSASETMNYIVSLNGDKLFEKVVEVLPAPIILSLLPLNPPAGVPVKFYAVVDFDDNNSLSYKWDFGDGEIVTTDAPFASHIYTDLKDYKLSLEVSVNGDLTSTKVFDIEAISPEAAIDTSLIFKRNALEGVASVLEEFSFWYSDALSKVVDVVSFKDELSRLDRARNNSFSNKDFISVAEELYALDIPIGVDINSFEGSYLMTELKDIDIEPVEIISGAVEGSSADYADSILNWQNTNIDVDFVSKEFVVSLWSGKNSGVFRVYSFDVSSKHYDESYFVINRAFNELHFEKDVGAKAVGNATVIALSGESDNMFEFYYEGAEPTTSFVSPKLSSIVIEGNIDVTCNYNLVCEEEYGENPNTCRSDCKPVTHAVVYMILSLVLIFIVYSILQVWYKWRYEKYLFKDNRQLYNLLMYVTNARVRGMNDSRIRAELRLKRWSSERVNYIIKKSRGERTGLYEIIPFEKIAALFRNWKARKAHDAKVNIATGNRQQTRRNINKSRFQKRI